jgi:hypothetical protein
MGGHGLYFRSPRTSNIALMTSEDVDTIPRRTGVAVFNGPDDLTGILQSRMGEFELFRGSLGGRACVLLLNLIHIHTIDSSEFLRYRWGSHSLPDALICVAPSGLRDVS